LYMLSFDFKLALCLTIRNGMPAVLLQIVLSVLLHSLHAHY